MLGPFNISANQKDLAIRLWIGPGPASNLMVAGFSAVDTQELEREDDDLPIKSGCHPWMVS